MYTSASAASITATDSEEFRCTRRVPCYWMWVLLSNRLVLDHCLSVYRLEALATVKDYRTDMRFLEDGKQLARVEADRVRS